MSELREAVRERYAGLAGQLAGSEGCCGSGEGDICCPSGSYQSSDLAELGLGESVSLGCGNPTLLASLQPGEVVLDLGSGGGLDVLLSARRVGPRGHAYGIDMTDEMLELAERNRSQAGVDNATFLRGTIERVPLPEASVDVVISNCVINLAEDKGVVLREAYRVLRVGGRLAVADMVEVEPLAPEIKRAVDSWAGCIAGTIPVADYLALLVGAGFEEPEVEVHDVQTVPGGAGKVGSAYIRARKQGAGSEGDG
ncbi:MAG: arsenite methyltransferase [Candidatus Dormibacteria bacterium]